LVGVNFQKITARIGKLDMESIRDMLRYDLAFVHPDWPGIVAFPVFRTKYGNLGGTVTKKRWQSFAVNVGAIGLSTGGHYELVEHMNRHADSWLTYQHPTVGHNPTDYGRLEPFSFKRYLEIKDHRDATKMEAR